MNIEQWKTAITPDVVIGALTYLYLVLKTAFTKAEKIEGLSFPTFLLWAIVTGFVAASLYKQGASYQVAAIYGSGAAMLTLVLLYKGKTEWSWFNTLIAVLVVGCIVTWLTLGAMWTLYLSVSAAVIAAIPLIIVCWKIPGKSEIVGNAGFLTANILALYAVRNGSFENQLYPTANVIVCSLLVAPWALHQIRKQIRKCILRKMGGTVQV